jgi:hypothetical protein
MATTSNAVPISKAERLRLIAQTIAETTPGFLQRLELAREIFALTPL